MKRMQKLLAPGLALVLCAALLAGCGASKSSVGYSAGASAQQDTAWNETATQEAGGAGTDGKSAAEIGQLLPQAERKIIYNATLSLESKEFETSRDSLLQAAAKAKGYVQSSDEGGSAENGSRWVNYTFRIPSTQYAGFLNSVSGTANLLQKTEATQDVTAEYVDIEARLSSLATQEKRLLELAEKAEKLEDLLAIESKLSEVRYQIESYTGQQRVYDSLISYSTVEVMLDEVRLLTPAASSFGSRVATAFKGSWNGFVNGMQDFVIGLIYMLPMLVAGVAVAVGIIIVLRQGKKRRAQADPGQKRADTLKKDPPEYNAKTQ